MTDEQKMKSCKNSHFHKDHYIHGMADAAHELGLDIVFDKDFKIHVMGINSTWATKYEY